MIAGSCSKKITSKILSLKYHNMIELNVLYDMSQFVLYNNKKKTEMIGDYCRHNLFSRCLNLTYSL